MRIDFSHSQVHTVDPSIYTNTLAVGHYHGHRTMAREYDCLVMIQSGAATYHQKTQSFTVRTGDILFLSHGSNYTIDVHEEYRHTWFDFMLIRTDGGANECFGMPVTEIMDVERIFQQLRRRSQNISPSACMKRLSLIYELLAILAKEDVMDYISTDKRTKIDEIRALIDEKACDDAFTCSGLAQSVGMSEVHFRRLFTKMFGQTPAQYLMSVRVARAKEKLLHTDESIGEIAQKTGFSNQNYFSRVFHRETGVTPSDYRNSMY